MGFLVFQERGLGDLELQPLRLQARLHQRAEDDLEQVALLELDRRDIDGDLDVRGPVGGVRTGRFRIHSPSGTIRPVDSASGMK